MAESSGRQDAIDNDSNGSTDRGIWQINSVHSQFNPSLLLSNALYNAKAAVAIYNGSGWGAWTTYTSGAYQRYLGGNSGTTTTQTVKGITRPGGAGAATATSYPVPSSQGITQIYSQLLGATGSASSDPTYVDDSTIGGRASGVLDAILSPLKWALGQEKEGYNELHNLINGPAKAADDVSHVAEDGWKILESLPWYTLRFSEFTSGIVMMVFGIYLSMKNRSSGGPARAARTVLSYTPAGRAVEARKFTRIGTREGRQEHYRLQGRRSERTRLSSQQAEKIQSAGKASRNTNNT